MNLGGVTAHRLVCACVIWLATLGQSAGQSAGTTASTASTITTTSTYDYTTIAMARFIDTTSPSDIVDVDCGQPDAPVNGSVYVTSTVYNSYAYYYCDAGHWRDGSGWTRCMESGNWSHTAPTCVYVDCGQPDAPENGRVDVTSTYYGSWADYYCDAGHWLDGSIWAWCRESGDWSHPAPKCVYVDCGQPDAPENGHVDVTSTYYGSWAVYYCDAGYWHNGSRSAWCRESGNWSNPAPMCNYLYVDCGRPEAPENGGVHVTSTRVNGTATYFCDVGYQLNGSSVATCMVSGEWLHSVPACNIVVCPTLDNPSNGRVEVSNSDYRYGTIAAYTCDDGHSIVGVTNRMCLHTGEWSETEPMCWQDPIVIVNCPPDQDARGTDWPETAPGKIVVKDCTNFKADTEGRIIRNCSMDGKWRPTVYNCRRQEFAKAAQEISAIVDNPTTKGVEDALSTLSNLTQSDDTDNDGLFEAEIEEVTSFLGKLVDVSRNVSVTQAQSNAFYSIISNLFDTKNENTWSSIRSNTDTEGPVGAVKALSVIGPYSDIVADSLTENDTSRDISQTNIDLTVVRIGENQTDVSFPPAQTNSVGSSNLFLPKESLNGSSSYSVILYPSLNGIIPADSERASKNADLNAAVLCLRLQRKMSTHNQIDPEANLTKPVRLTFGHFKSHMVDPQCSFWNFERYKWDTEGCQLSSTSADATVCECSHLTNFAILMSPWLTGNVDSLAIGVISYLGCSLSSICLLITVTLHIIMWRYVKGDRTVILMNMCVALVISYVIFLAGVHQTDNQDACAAVAILLQYVYLAVFFLMLAEGVEIGITVLFVRPPISSRLRWMLPLAWGVPAVIVAISVGVTQLEGYGNADFCWLSTDSGLVWSFVGPALAVILINFVLLLLVMRAMFQTRAISQKTMAEKTKVGIRCLCVMLPLMGCSWVLGVFYVSEDVSWIQYVFALCNSLQGVVIFIFHCFFNGKLRKALSKTRKRHWDSMRTSSRLTSLVFLPRISRFYTKSAKYDPPQAHDIKSMDHGTYTGNSFDDGTDSYADKPTTDSYVNKSTTDSYAENPTTDSYADKSTTDSYADKPTTDSCADKSTTDSYADKPTTDSCADKPTTDSYSR